MELLDLPAGPGAESPPPPLLFVGEVAEVTLAPTASAHAGAMPWMRIVGDGSSRARSVPVRIAPALIVLASVAVVVVGFLLLGYAFGKAVLGG